MFTSRAEAIEGAISNTPPDGQTALYDAVAAALGMLPNGKHDKKALLIISDGGDTVSQHNLDDVLKLAAQSSALIYTIGIFDDEHADRNPGVLRRIAEVGGGEAYFPEKLTDIVAICQRIAHDIRNQYTLAYVSSTDGRPGVYRSIRVSAQAPGRGKLRVRARDGYIPAPLVKRKESP
jgi:VWFA-related protein